MPHFFNKSKGYYISTNYKVLYSLLSRQPSLQAIEHGNLRFSAYAKKYLLSNRHRWYLIVRNPYDRLESFYKDKFVKTPSHKLLEYDQLQHCQKVFLPYLNIKRGDLPETIREKLLDFSFIQFIRTLPNTYLLNDHLYPQSMKTKLYLKNLKILSIPLTRIFRMESYEDMNYLQEKLCLDLSKKYNHTDIFKLANTWNPDLVRIVNRLYKKDFKRFGRAL